MDRRDDTPDWIDEACPVCDWPMSNHPSEPCKETR